MHSPEGFPARLAFVLKLNNLSAAALGAAVQVDKSVVSRWLSGRSRPSGHNLARISAEIARLRPGFSILLWESEASEFLQALGVERPPSPAQPAAATSHPAPPPEAGALRFHHDVVGAARREFRRGFVDYSGLYYLHAWSFRSPGAISRVPLMFRANDGLLEARLGPTGRDWRGSVLQLTFRLYVMLTEESCSGMTYLILNTAPKERGRPLTGLMLTVSSDADLTPAATPVALALHAGLTGDAAQDDAAFEEMRRDTRYLEPVAVTDTIRAVLTRAGMGGNAGFTGMLAMPGLGAM